MKRSRRIAPGAICNVTALLLCLPAAVVSASMRTAVTSDGTSYSRTASHGIWIMAFSHQHPITRVQYPSATDLGQLADENLGFLIV